MEGDKLYGFLNLYTCGVGENLSTGLKEKNLSNDLASEIIAFANTDGSQIFWNKDNGEIIGIEENKLDSLNLLIMFHITIVSLSNGGAGNRKGQQGKVVLIANVPKGDKALPN